MSNIIQLTHPKFRRRFNALNEHLLLAYQSGRTECLFKPFEGFRLPDRQLDLLKRKVTKAAPWQSAHNYGMAIDFVPWVTEEDAKTLSARWGRPVPVGWSWSPGHPYDFLKTSAPEFDLSVPISWDLCHVEPPEWQELKKHLL